MDQRVQNLTDEAHDIRRAQRRRDVLIGVLALLTAALAVIGSVSLVRISDLRAAAKSNHDLQHQIAENTNIIKDCTQPAGACFRAGQRRTQAAVSVLVNSINSGLHVTVCNLLSDLDQAGLLSPATYAKVATREHC